MFREFFYFCKVWKNLRVEGVVIFRVLVLWKENLKGMKLYFCLVCGGGIVGKSYVDVVFWGLGGFCLCSYMVVFEGRVIFLVYGMYSLWVLLVKFIR